MDDADDRSSKITMYMRFYIADYLADTDHLKLEEHGAYTMLLMKMWQRGGWLPQDPVQLAQMCRVSRRRFDRVLWPVIGAFFTVDVGLGRFTQGRLLEELERAKALCAKQARNGKRGGRGKVATPYPWQSHGLPMAKPTQSHGLPMAKPWLTHGKADPDPDGPDPAPDPDPDPDPDPPSAPAGDPGRVVPRRCTGYDLTRCYGLQRGNAVPGAVSFRVPRPSAGKATTLAESLTPEEIADVPATMALHFQELLAGKGKAGALESPTLGFGCWMGDFSRLRERLNGTTPAATTPPPRSSSSEPPRGATDAAKAAALAAANSYLAKHG